MTSLRLFYMGDRYLNGYRKLNTPKAEIGFGLDDVCTEDVFLFFLVLIVELYVCFREQHGNEELDSEIRLCPVLSTTIHQVMASLPLSQTLT